MISVQLKIAETLMRANSVGAGHLPRSCFFSFFREMLINLGLLWFARLVFSCNNFGDFCDSAEEGEGGVWPSEQVGKMKNTFLNPGQVDKVDAGNHIED